MHKIDKNILDNLELSDLVFKYPVDGSSENIFDPNVNKSFEKYMIIKKEKDEIRLSKETSFLHENPKAIENITKANMLDGTWWVLPKEANS